MNRKGMNRAAMKAHRQKMLAKVIRAINSGINTERAITAHLSLGTRTAAGYLEHLREIGAIGFELEKVRFKPHHAYYTLGKFRGFK